MKLFQHISVSQTRELIADGSVALLDIRDPVSYHNGHIDGALLLDNSNLQQFLAATDRETPVVVYCYHGNSSQNAAQVLAQQGFTQVYSMDGGYEAWRMAPGAG